MKILSKRVFSSIDLNFTSTKLITGNGKYIWRPLLVCLVVFWAMPSFAEIYVYERKGSYYITDLYQGANFKKRYTTKRSKPKLLSRSSVRKKSYINNINDFSNEISKASRKYGINSNFIKAIIAAESAFEPRAVSPKGAMGLMQLMPQTAKRFNVGNPFDPHENIDAGTRYVKRLLAQFRGNKHLALAAYNAGENTVKKYGSIPPFRETTNYVRNVLNYFDFYEGKTKSRMKRTVIYKKISSTGTAFFSDNAQIKFTQ